MRPLDAILERRLGASGLAVFYAKLSPEYSPIWRLKPIATVWYPEDMLVDILSAMVDELGIDLLPEVGYEQQRTTIKSLHTFFARLAGPERLLAVAGKAWGMDRDSGNVEIVDVRPGVGLARVLNHTPMMERGYAECYSGAVRAALESSGAKEVRVSIHREPPSTTQIHTSWQSSSAARNT